MCYVYNISLILTGIYHFSAEYAFALTVRFKLYLLLFLRVGFYNGFGPFIDSLLDGKYSLRSDDELMYLMQTKTFNYSVTVKKCNRLPGHRIATAQQYSQYLAIAEIAMENGM